MACALALLAVGLQAGSGDAAPNLTLEWIYSDAGRALTRLPSYAWLNDGTALYLDARAAGSVRRLERLDPATGARRPAVDEARARASLTAVAPGMTLGLLEWPEAIDRSGRRVFYLIDDDVFALDLTAATFTRLTSTPSEEKDVNVSPDGTHVAFVRDHDLYTIDLATRAETRLTHDGSETTLNGTLSWLYWEEIFGRKDTGWWWAPDGRSIAYLQFDESAVAVSEFVDFRPEQPRILHQRYPRAGSTNPRVRVGLVSVNGGDTRWVAIDDAPFEYVLRVVWLPDSRQVSVQTLTRDQQELALYFADAGTGRARRILTERDPAWVNVTDDLRFLPSRGQFLWASERNGYMHLYRYALDGSLVNEVTRGDWALATADETVFWVRQSVAGVDEREGWVYFVSLEQSPVERQLYRVRLDGSGLSRVSAGRGSHGISMSPDTSRYFDAFTDVRTPPGLTLRRADASLVAELAPPPVPAFAGRTLSFPEITTIPARDGFRMPALVFKPVTVPAGRRLPVIMFVYGGPSAPTVKDAWQEYTLFYQLLLDAGYSVVQVDNRAATGISKTLENTILRKSGGPETEDLLDAARWLKAQSWVDGERLGVFGWSGGGTMTLNLLTRTQEFKAGISIAPVTDWRYYDTKWAEALMRRPADNPEGYNDFSLVRRAPQLHGRLLLVFGTDDDNVHPQNEQAFIDALIRAGITFDTAIYPMRTHGIGDDAARIHLFKTMLEFWNRWL